MVYEAVKVAALHAGARPDRVELIGLLPKAALEPGSEWMNLVMDTNLSERTLERRLESPMEWP
jgi:glutamate formiminotransferase